MLTVRQRGNGSLCPQARSGDTVSTVFRKGTAATARHMTCKVVAASEALQQGRRDREPLPKKQKQCDLNALVLRAREQDAKDRYCVLRAFSDHCSMMSVWKGNVRSFGTDSAPCEPRPARRNHSCRFACPCGPRCARAPGSTQPVGLGIQQRVESVSSTAGRTISSKCA